MKKNTPSFNPGFLLALLFSACVLTGCFSSATPIAYNPATPPEQTCTLNIAANFTVKEFDGQAVDWQAGFATWAAVQLAEGSHTFLLNYTQSAGANQGRYTLNDIVITYDRFTAGHTYLLAAQMGMTGAGSRTMPIRIGIKDVTNEPDWASLSKAFNWTEGFQWLPMTIRKKGN